jgi:hypothetical protein
MMMVKQPLGVRSMVDGQPCPRCFKPSPASAKFCRRCGLSFPSNMATAFSVGTAAAAATAASAASVWTPPSYARAAASSTPYPTKPAPWAKVVPTVAAPPQPTFRPAQSTPPKPAPLSYATPAKAIPKPIKVKSGGKGSWLFVFVGIMAARFWFNHQSTSYTPPAPTIPPMTFPQYKSPTVTFPNFQSQPNLGQWKTPANTGTSSTGNDTGTSTYTPPPRSLYQPPTDSQYLPPAKSIRLTEPLNSNDGPVEPAKGR